MLKKWAEGDFKNDPQLNLIPSLYNKLKQEGHDFSEPQVTPKREVQLSKDPNVVNSQQEEDDIAKAIELSLKEKTASPKVHSQSLYPSVNATSVVTSSNASASAPAPEPRKVRALYDFEAAEDNELTFKAGELIMVIEESDPNWWRGTNHRGEGFFPANFVTADLSVEPEDLNKEIKSSKKSHTSDNDVENSPKIEQPVEVNEDAIDRLLFLLHEADPSDPSQDSDEMLRLENAVNQMGPLIDAELERVDRKHAQLTQLSSDLIDTINLYHSLMRETERTPMAMPPAGAFLGHPMYGTPEMFQNPYMQQRMVQPPGMSFNQPSGHFGPPGSFYPRAGPANFQMPPNNFQMPSGPMQNGHPVNQGNIPQTQQHLPAPGMMTAPHSQPMGGITMPQQAPPAPGKIVFLVLKLLNLSELINLF